VDKMFPLRPGRLPSNTVQNIVFITRPRLSLMELVAQNVLKLVTVVAVIWSLFILLCLVMFSVIYYFNSSGSVFRMLLSVKFMISIT